MKNQIYKKKRKMAILQKGIKRTKILIKKCVLSILYSECEKVPMPSEKKKMGAYKKKKEKKKKKKGHFTKEIKRTKTLIKKK